LLALHGAWKSHQLFTVLGQAPSLAFYWMDGKGKKKKHLRRLIGKTMRPRTSPCGVLEQVIFQQLMKRSTYFLHSKSHLNKLSSTTYEKKSNDSTLLFYSQAP